MIYDLSEPAVYGTLREVPVEALTRANMLAPDADGWTPLHAAALNGHLDQVPEAILNDRDAMLTPNSAGLTPLRLAASSGHSHQLPEALRAEAETLSEASNKRSRTR